MESQQPFLLQIEDHFRGSGFPPFPDDIAAMGIDGVYAPEKLLCDLLTGQPRFKELKDLELAGGKNISYGEEFRIGVTKV